MNMKCNMCNYEGEMNTINLPGDTQIMCPECGENPHDRPGFVYGDRDPGATHCSICGQAFGPACDGTHAVCPYHKKPYVGGECMECLTNEMV